MPYLKILFYKEKKMLISKPPELSEIANQRNSSTEKKPGKSEFQCNVGQIT